MELTTESPCTHVELNVPNFFEMGDSLTSPEFSFAGDTYCLRFSQNEDTGDSDLQLVRLTSDFPERAISYRVGYGLSDLHGYLSNYISLAGTIGFCASRSKLEEDIDEYVMCDTLRMLIFLRLEEQSSAAQKRSGLPGIHKLQSGKREQLLQKGTESDACVVVHGKVFQVHKNGLLRTHSTVFEAMFGHDSAEKKSGRVVIDDLDPHSFGDFLEYLYTGAVQSGLSDDNVFGLYAAADKYDVTTLKSECVAHMLRTLSVNTFCDVMTLALSHSEEELLQQSIRFYETNFKRIIKTAKWDHFRFDNVETAIELLFKVLAPRTQ